jgi:hypothetical protein
MCQCFGTGSNRVVIGLLLEPVQYSKQHDTTLHFVAIHFNIILLASIILKQNSIGKTKNETERLVVVVYEAQQREETLFDTAVRSQL